MQNTVNNYKFTVMLRMKLLPKHVTTGNDPNRSFIQPDASNYMRKGSHSVEKYNPRKYLRKNDATPNAIQPPMFYEYKIRIRSTASLPLGEYRNMANKITQGGTRLPDISPKQILAHSTISGQDMTTPVKARGEKAATEFKAAAERVAVEFMPRSNNKSWAYPGTDKGQIKIKDEQKRVIATPGSKSSVDQNKQSEEAFTSKEEIRLGKEKMRKKWKKLNKRTLFTFDIDLVNDTIDMRREKKPGVQDDVEEKMKAKMKQDIGTLSPHLQKKQALEDRQRRPSVLVYYKVGAESPLKMLSTANHAPELPAIVLKNKLRDNLKIGMKVRKFLQKGTIETTFDLDKIDFSKMDPANYLTLYLTIKKAIAPTFYLTGCDELNKIDSEIAELIKSRTAEETGATEYDNSILSLYHGYLDQAEKEQILSGFWQVKKVYGNKPTCRESAMMVSFEERFYIFGGYGVDRMNDLWCLSGSDSLWNWTLLRPLGTKIPDKRYGQCMTNWRNEIYVFAGVSDFLAGLKMRVALGDMWKYSIEDNMWTEIETKGTKVEKRAYGASCTIDGLWFIHGGTNGSNREVLNSMVVFNFGKLLARSG